jgi:hypothetical protein
MLLRPRWLDADADRPPPLTPSNALLREPLLGAR